MSIKIGFYAKTILATTAVVASLLIGESDAAIYTDGDMNAQTSGCPNPMPYYTDMASAQARIVLDWHANSAKATINGTCVSTLGSGCGRGNWQGSSNQMSYYLNANGEVESGSIVGSSHPYKEVWLDTGVFDVSFGASFSGNVHVNHYCASASANVNIQHGSGLPPCFTDPRISCP